MIPMDPIAAAIPLMAAEPIAQQDVRMDPADPAAALAAAATTAVTQVDVQTLLNIIQAMAARPPSAHRLTFPNSPQLSDAEKTQRSQATAMTVIQLQGAINLFNSHFSASLDAMTPQQQADSFSMLVRNEG